MNVVDIKTATHAGGDFNKVPVTVSYPASLGAFRSDGVALSKFFTSYGSGTDHHVGRLAAFGILGGTNGSSRTVETELSAVMRDDSGHVASSSLHEAVPAVLGPVTGSLIFEDDTATSGKESSVIFNQSVDEAYLVVAGFDVSYSGGDHHVKSLMLQFDGVNFTPGDASINFTPDLRIEDGSGNSGTGTAYVLGIGQTSNDPNQFRQLNWRSGQGEQTVEIRNQPTAIDQAFVFIREIELTYGNSDHHVREITIDAGNTNLTTADKLEADGTHTWKITFTPTLTMEDASGNKQSSASDIDLLVLATPQPA